MSIMDSNHNIECGICGYRFKTLSKIEERYHDYDLCEECYAAITNRKRKEVENEKRWIGIYNATFFLWGV